jgi:hypothetical protein
MKDPVGVGRSSRTPISREDFRALLEGIRKDAFRLEALPQYLVESETEAFAAYCRGELLPPPRTEAHQRWDSLVREFVSSGRVIARVHMLPPKLTPYLRFEIEWGYAFTATAGEDIRLLTAEASADLRQRAAEDFWLLDDSVLVFIVYDSEGRYLRFESESDPERTAGAVALKEALLKEATPLREYLQQTRGRGGR